MPVPRQTISTSKILHTAEETMTSYHLKTFQSSTHYNLKKTVESLTARRPIVVNPTQSTYLTYDSIDAPPPPPPSTTTAKEYSI